MKSLLVLTVAGQKKWLGEALNSLRDDLDVLVVDDATPAEVGIKELCSGFGAGFLTKPAVRGLTNSWNMAFNYYQKRGYEKCIISNDDVRFPRGFSEKLLEGTDSYDLVGPLTNKPQHQPRQGVTNYVSHSSDIDAVQTGLSRRYGKDPFLEIDHLNGFCFAFSRRIENHLFSNEPGEHVEADSKRRFFPEKLLFNPVHINIFNEDSLCKRIKRNGGRIFICLASYVYHRQGRTFARMKTGREKLWTDAWR